MHKQPLRNQSGYSNNLTRLRQAQADSIIFK